MADSLVKLDQVVTRFGEHTVHDGISLEVRRGEVVAIIGGSGTGKSVLLKEIIGLIKPESGHIALFGENILTAGESEMQQLRQRFGMLFQDGALFSSLNVEQNVATPLLEHSQLPKAVALQLARLKLLMVGLPDTAFTQMPSELSGGMRKRAALARALALDPELLFLDEPTSGLDPISARGFDHLIRTLANSLGLTVLLITHDLNTLLSIVDRVVVLAEGKVLGTGSVAEIRQINNPWLTDYFSSSATMETAHGN